MAQTGKSFENQCSQVQEIVEMFVNKFVSPKGPEHDLDGLHEFLMDAIEKIILEKTLTACQGSQSRAAAVLGLHRNTLSQKLKAHSPQSSRSKTRVRFSSAASLKRPLLASSSK